MNLFSRFSRLPIQKRQSLCSTVAWTYGLIMCGFFVSRLPQLRQQLTLLDGMIFLQFSLSFYAWHHWVRPYAQGELLSPGNDLYASLSVYMARLRDMLSKMPQDEFGCVKISGPLPSGLQPDIFIDQLEAAVKDESIPAATRYEFRCALRLLKCISSAHGG